MEDRPTGRDTEFPVVGMPNSSGEGFVDYVLWGDDGKPLGLVEAKRTKIDPRVGQQQAKLYADCLEKQSRAASNHFLFQRLRPLVVGRYALSAASRAGVLQERGTRPSDSAPLHPTETSGDDDQRSDSRAPLSNLGPFEKSARRLKKDHDRKSLLVMATGSGKTRTVIALADVLMRANWAKRILFLADRVALVNQAVNAFKKHLPSASPVNLVTDPNEEGRVFVSTYPTMMGLIEETDAGQRRFGPGHFDLIIIDEAHRSVYQKYRAIFDYFDSLARRPDRHAAR